MRKKMTIALMVIFLISFMIGVFVTTASAKPPTPCTYKCINQDTYLCCLYWRGGEIVEECYFDHYGCP